MYPMITISFRTTSSSWSAPTALGGVGVVALLFFTALLPSANAQSGDGCLQFVNNQRYFCSGQYYTSCIQITNSDWVARRDGGTEMCASDRSSIPTATLTASKTDLRQGESFALTWSSNNATACTGTGFSTGGATSGSLTLRPADDTSYSVVCTKQSLIWAKTSGPTTTNLSGSCSPTGLTQTGACPAQEGTGCATLNSACTTTFRDPDAGFCRTTRTTYQCQGQTQSATASASVTVRDVSVTLTSNPGTVASGGSATLSWNVTGATTCTSNGFNWGNQMSGSTTVTPKDSTSYSLVCNNGTPQISGSWRYKETDTSDLSCSGSTLCTPYSNNDSRLPYGPVPSCSPLNPSGTSCTQSGAICKNGYWDAGANQSPYKTDLYECTATGSTGSSDADSASVTVTRVADLVGQVGGAVTVNRNQPVTLYGGVANEGTADASYFPNVIQVCDENCATVNQVLEATPASSLAAGGWQQVSASYTPASPNRQFYRVCANLNRSLVNVHTESNYGNNCSGWQNLTVTSNALSVSCVASPDDTLTNESVTWEAFVNNPGGGSSGQSWQLTSSGGNTKVCSGGSNTTAFQNTCPDGVYNGASCSTNQVGTKCKVAQDQDACEADGGTVYGSVEHYYCRANSTNAPNYTYSWSGTDGLSGTSKQVAKSYSTVGTKQGTVSVQGSDGTTGTASCQAIIAAPPSVPDLTAGGITPTTASLGQTRALSGTVTNSGRALARASRSYFEVIAPNPKGNRTSIVTTSAIAAGAGDASSFNYTFSYSGSYSARICADWYGEVNESNEGNNCGPWTSIAVSEAPVGSSVSCSVNTQSAVVGGSVTYTAHPVAAATSPYSWTGSDGATGFGNTSTAVRTFAAPGNYGMQVRATRASTPAQCPLVSVAAGWCTGGTPELSIEASQTRVRSGQSVNLEWTARGVIGNGTECTVVGPGVSWRSAVTVAPACSAGGTASPTITTQSTYTLTCGAATDSVTVNVIPNFQEF